MKIDKLVWTVSFVNVGWIHEKLQLEVERTSTWWGKSCCLASKQCLPVSHVRWSHLIACRPLAEKMAFQEVFKNNKVLTSFRHRFVSLLAAFWEAKAAPKSSLNLSKSSSRACPFRQRFPYRLLVLTLKIVWENSFATRGTPHGFYMVELHGGTVQFILAIW